MNGYVGEEHVNDSKDKDGRRKPRNVETMSNRMLSKCTTSGRYQRLERRQRFGGKHKREIMI